MKLRNPKSKNHLNIKRKYHVLDVGGGHDPHPRANVVVDKYDDDNSHRCGDLVVRKNQTFVKADGESLPFEDNEFDYVVCKHVLEHVDDPIKFLKELSRVGKMGYLETPSLIGEFLHPKASHKWLLMEIDDELILYDKDKVNFVPNRDFGELFLTYLQSQSLGYKIFDKTEPLMRQVQIEWKDEITCLVNPDMDEYLRYFAKPWDLDMVKKIFPPRSVKKEIISMIQALLDITRVYMKK